MYDILEVLALDQGLVLSWHKAAALFIALGILAAAALGAGTGLIKAKKRCDELESHLTMMEKAMEEFRTIRHQYNNIFQSAVFYIENEQWGSSGSFVTEIMARAAALNKNNTLQLIKIKNRRIRGSISQMAGICDKNAIDFTVTVVGEINQINVHESSLCSALSLIFNDIRNEIIGFDKKEINIEIISEGQGIAILFYNYYETEEKAVPYRPTQPSDHCAARDAGSAAIKRLMAKYTNIVYNSYIDSDYHWQEIMIM